MGGSRRKYKRSRTKVQVRLPKKNPHLFKLAFNLPPKLKTLLDALSKWDDKGSVIENYKSFGVFLNPNFLGVRARTDHVVESDALQMPPGDAVVSEFDLIDSGSELEEDVVYPSLKWKNGGGEVRTTSTNDFLIPRK